jgi:hypothetical protein
MFSWWSKNIQTAAGGFRRHNAHVITILSFRKNLDTTESFVAESQKLQYLDI